MPTAAPPQPPVSAKQGDFIQALRSRLYRYMLFGGGTGGGKSYLGAKMFINLAMTQPGTSYGVFRKNMVTLKRTTYKTFQKCAKQQGLIEGRDYAVNRSEMTWTFVVGESVIYFMELDVTKDPELNKLGGLELTAAMIDEADEVAEAAFNVLRFRIGRNNFNDEFAFIYLTCNPNQSWVRFMFYDPSKRNKLDAPFYFLESLITDNTFQSSQAIEAASDPTAPAQFVERYFRGNWDYQSDPLALFPTRVIDRILVDRYPETGHMTMGVDVSREGEDRTIFSLFKGGMLVDLFEPDIDRGDEAPISHLIGEAVLEYMVENQVGFKDVWVDGGGGYGGGVIDHLRAKGYYVNTWQSGAKPTELHKDGSPKYDMLRSQKYWNLSQAAAAGEFKIWSSIPFLSELRKELSAHGFEENEKKFLVHGKKIVKKLLGHSPDFADAVMMGWWPPVVEGSRSIETGGDWNDVLKDGDGW